MLDPVICLFTPYHGYPSSDTTITPWTLITAGIGLPYYLGLGHAGNKRAAPLRCGLGFIACHVCRHTFTLSIYYPPEVRRGEYWGLGVFLLQYSPLVSIYEKYCIMIAQM